MIRRTAPTSWPKASRPSSVARRVRLAAVLAKFTLALSLRASWPCTKRTSPLRILEVQIKTDFWLVRPTTSMWPTPPETMSATASGRRLLTHCPRPSIVLMTRAWSSAAAMEQSTMAERRTQRQTSPFPLLKWPNMDGLQWFPMVICFVTKILSMVILTTVTRSNASAMWTQPTSQHLQWKSAPWRRTRPTAFAPVQFITEEQPTHSRRLRHWLSRIWRPILLCQDKLMDPLVAIAWNSVTQLKAPKSNASASRTKNHK